MMQVEVHAAYCLKCEDDGNATVGVEVTSSDAPQEFPIPTIFCAQSFANLFEMLQDTASQQELSAAVPGAQHSEDATPPQSLPPPPPHLPPPS